MGSPEIKVEGCRAWGVGRPSQSFEQECAEIVWRLHEIGSKLTSLLINSVNVDP